MKDCRVCKWDIPNGDYCDQGHYRGAKVDRSLSNCHGFETHPTEKEMREEEAPWPKEMKELTDYIDSLTERPHDYGTCCYAVSLAATAAFQYVAGKLGITGFQASCADLDVLRRTRRIKGPFAIIRGEDMLYPQYDIVGKVHEYIKEWQQWVAEEAQKKIDKCNREPGRVHPDVWAHWKALASRGGGESIPESGFKHKGYHRP